MSRMSYSSILDTFKDNKARVARTQSTSRCSVLLRYRDYNKRPWRIQSSHKVPLYSPYHLPDKEQAFVHHALSMPSLSPAPLEAKSSLSHSASDIQFSLDDADRFTCNKQKQYLTLKDLDFIQLIGTGMYSKVYLVQSRTIHRDYFALKVIPKYKLKQNSAKTEADIMLSLDHPLIVKTWNSFEDEKNIYMLMDFAAGGELFYHLRGRARFDEDTARFYAAEVVLALEHMHSRNIAYRDLKLENLVLSDNGHVQLTDFGFAKQMEDTRTFTLCGTPEYLAPEIIRGTGYSMAVDWWALGVLLFEMLAGYSPFYSDSPLEIYKNILRGSVRFSSCMSEAAKDLLKGLLSRDATQRLGGLRNGVSELRSHPFFASIDWDTLPTRRPPLIPAVSGKGDTKYFKIDDYEDDECNGADVPSGDGDEVERASVVDDADLVFDGF